MLQRIWLIATRDFTTYLRRPMVWVWISLIALTYWGLTSGEVTIQTGGDSSIGGTRQHQTSEFEVTRLMSAMTLLFHGFFATVLFGMATIRDFDTGMMPLLHSSRLRPFEYLLGKFIGCLLLVFVVLVANALLAIFFMYGIPPATRADYFGEFHAGNFIKPLFKFSLPSVMLLAGMAFALGTITRKPVLVFCFPLIFLLVFGLFLNNWSPVWLPTWANNMLSLIDPYGTRWLNETYFNVDRGAEYYNTQPIVFGAAFTISRLLIVGLGVLAFLSTIPLFRRYLRGTKQGPLSAVDQPNSRHTERARLANKSAAHGLAALQMTQANTGWLTDTWNILRYELKELRHSPSMYLFVPFIVIEVLGTSFFREGAFGTPLLHTSGTLAEGAMSTLSILGCLLMMFFTVESQMRERVKKLAPVYYATRARSFAILLGKSLANTAVCVAIMAAALVACCVMLAIQGSVGFEVFPFVGYWILLLMPTFLLWGAFITFTIVATRNRYTTYGIAALVLIGTLYLNLSNETTWFSNWMLIGLPPWSDIAVFEMDRIAMILNRLFALSLSVLFTYLATRFYWRRTNDAVQLATRIKPRPIGSFALKTVPFAILPVIFGSMLWSQVNHGHQGEVNSDKEADYWKQNFSTWANTTPPSISGVDVELEIDPDNQYMNVSGTLRLTNDETEPMSRFVLTGGTHWKDIRWKRSSSFVVGDNTPQIPSRNGLEKYEPEDRSGLFVFRFDPPLKPGESTKLWYSFNGRFPDGISKNGGENMEFILPSGVVMTSFGNTFLPVPGFSEQVGLDGEDQPEAKEFEDGFFEQPLKPLFGGGDHFHVRTTITGPENYTFNGVGVKKSDNISDNKRKVIWETDSPVAFFNVVGGQWKVHKGKHSEIYYSEKHEYNVNELSDAIDEARAWYSKWFMPYPWKELRLNEFPNMASYAQGFATNITFSEGIGFLTRDKPGSNAPFMVAAHEAAHQWWGNILVPGQGPGGNILSEGMAHFSTGLLMEQVKGERARIEFFTLIEDQYGERRSVDSERPLVKIDGSKTGDTTVTYDKGGWVFYMLLNHMGRNENLQGIQSFIRKYSQTTDDYPVLQDFVNHMRNFADDPAAYDSFTQQWFFEVVVPQYEFSDVELSKEGGAWLVSGKVKNIGSGKMPLDIGAIKNDRFIDDAANLEYRDARTTVTVSADESVAFEIRCNFQPDKVVADPDVKVLQLKRKLAEHRF